MEKLGTGLDKHLTEHNPVLGNIEGRRRRGWQ